MVKRSHKRKGGRSVGVNIIDPADIVSQVVSNINIYFKEDGLNFCLQYSKITHGADHYELESSTIARNDLSFLDLTTAIGNIFDQKSTHFALQLSEFGKHLRVKRTELKNKISDIWEIERQSNRQKSRQDGHNIDHSVIKTYSFNRLAYFLIPKSGQVLILGFDSEKNIQDVKKRINQFVKNINQAIGFAKEQEESISQYLSIHEEENYETYAPIIQSYKKMLWEADIKNLHLFLFNAEDNRFYYHYTDSMQLNPKALKEYEIYFRDKSSDWSLAGEQIAYVINNLEKKLNRDKLSEEKCNEIKRKGEELLTLLSRPKELRDYFREKTRKKKKEKENLLRLILSCIPQEPWTGVAGYTSQTRVFDYNSFSTAESRWAPEESDPSLFYTRLMVYETLFDIGGKGNMAAFPILDCGQIAGVFFASRRKDTSGEFTSNTLTQLFTLSSALKHLVLLKKEDEFKNKVLSSLLETENHSLTEIIARHLPILFNPLLVVIWEQNLMNSKKPQSPSYIYGYKKDERNIQTLIPMTYDMLDVSDSMFESLGPQQFEKIRSFSNAHILSKEDVDESLTDELRKKYKASTIDWPSLSSNRANYPNELQEITSGMVYRYGSKSQEKNGWIIIYTAETSKILEKQKGFIQHKLDKINFIAQFDDNIGKFLQIKYLTTHDIKGSSIDPLTSQLDRSSKLIKEMLESTAVKESGIASTLKEIYSNLHFSINYHLPNLVENLSRIDDSFIFSKTYEQVPLIDIINLVWTDLITCHFERFKGAGFNIFDTYKLAAKCNIVLKNKNSELESLGINSKILQSKKSYRLNEKYKEEKWRKEIEKILITAPREYVYLIFFNILKNAYDPKVIRESRINKEKNAEVTIEITYKNNFIKASVSDRGSGMPDAVKQWANKLLLYAENQVKKQVEELGEKNLEYDLKMPKIDDTIRDFYKQHIDSDKASFRKGNGLYTVAFRMNEIHKRLFFEKKQTHKFITIVSTSGGSKINLSFQSENRYDHEKPEH